MKKTFKPPINWIMKKEYQKNLDSLMKQFFCNIKGIKKRWRIRSSKKPWNCRREVMWDE